MRHQWRHLAHKEWNNVRAINIRGHPYQASYTQHSSNKEHIVIAFIDIDFFLLCQQLLYSNSATVKKYKYIGLLVE